MFWLRSFLALGFVLVFSFPVLGANVFYVLNSEFGLTEGNEVLLDYFENRGDTVELWDNTLLQADPEGALEAADEADLVFIDESVSSSRADPLIPTTTPVINNEQYAFDNWGMAGLNVGHGSPNRPANDMPLDAGSMFGTSIDIVDPAHPIALGAGAAGLVQVYEDAGGRIDWGRPGAEANVIAQLPGFEAYQPAAAIFVYEAGSQLFDGTTAAGMRIGFFISDTNRGPEPEDPTIPDDGVDGSWEGNEATLLTDAGWSLLNATVDYALGIFAPPGDFNGDGVLDSQDIDELTRQAATGDNSAAFDLNGDQLVDDADVRFWANDLFGTWVGDADLDGQFNSGDLVVVLATGTYEADADAVWTSGDFNGSGRTDSGDLVAALANGGYEMGPRAAVASVPEPTSLTLVTLGLMFLACRRRFAGTA